MRSLETPAAAYSLNRLAAGTGPLKASAQIVFNGPGARRGRSRAHPFARLQSLPGRLASSRRPSKATAHR